MIDLKMVQSTEYSTTVPDLTIGTVLDGTTCLHKIKYVSVLSSTLVQEKKSEK